MDSIHSFKEKPRSTISSKIDWTIVGCACLRRMNEKLILDFIHSIGHSRWISGYAIYIPAFTGPLMNALIKIIFLGKTFSSIEI